MSVGRPHHINRVLERVRKMLAIANNEAASEEERDNALKMAHDLLTKHELDMMDVEISMRDTEDPRGSFTSDGWGAGWAKGIRVAMGKLFNCYYYNGHKINGTRSSYTFVGRESAATTAMYMGDWIVKSALKEADRRYGHRLNPTGRSFCVGVSDRIYTRVSEIIRSKQQELDLTSTALVLYDVAKREEEANLKFITDAGIRLVDGKQRASRVNSRAYLAGQEHGDGIQLSTQLKEKDPMKGLK